MINRREFIGMAAGAGAALALTPELLRAHQSSAGRLMQRAIPSSGEMLPVIGFGAAQESDDAGMKAILETLFDNGGRVVDGRHGGGEEIARLAAGELGIQNKFFWTTSLSVAAPNVGPVLPGVLRKADPAAVRAAMAAKLADFKVPRIDLVMVSTLDDTPTHLAVLREMKKEGRVRYIGVHHLAWPRNAPRPPFGELESFMRSEPLDFVATDYHVGDRRAEETLLPLARERKIGFMAQFAFDRGRLFQRASGTPLPEWAAEFDAKTWAHFFIKYVLSHPAVTVVRTGTTKAAHMLENIGGGIGRLPDEAMRKRMAQLVDSLPQPPAPPAPPPSRGRTMITAEQMQQRQANLAPTVALSAAILDRYVGEYQHAAVGTMVTVRRDGERLLVKVQGSTLDETPFVARSETRFASATIFAIEFQLDGQGKVTGATWETGPQRIPLVRR
jgi:aryl-alcohol dehydrogenase-like predicted oxidoreductase